MSNGATPSNTAGIYISTDYETFKQFLKDAFDGFAELKRKGKETNEDIAKSAQTFLNTAWKGAIFGLAKDMGDVMLKPLRTSLAEATDLARQYRAENTRLAYSVGRDFGDVGKQLDALATKTTRPQESLRTYGEAIREVTGSWQRAQEGAADYSDFARYLGRKTLDDMAGLASQMDSVWSVGGGGKAREFFNSLVAQAERIGVEGQRAARVWERLGAGMGGDAAKGDQGAKQAEESQRFVSALLKQGYSEAQVARITGGATALFSGNTEFLERHLRAGGQLKKGESIRDADTGLLRYSIPELLSKLQRTELKRSGGDRQRMLFRMRQNMDPLLASVLTGYERYQATMGEAAGGAPAPGAGPLDKAREAFDASPEGQRQAAELRKRTEDRRMGEVLLQGQDAIAKSAPGGAPGVFADAIGKGLGLGAIGNLLKGALSTGARVSPAGALLTTTMLRGDAPVWDPKKEAEWFGKHGAEFTRQQVEHARQNGPQFYLEAAARRRQQIADLRKPGWSGWLARAERKNPEELEAEAKRDEAIAAALTGKATADRLAELVLKVQVVGAPVETPSVPVGGGVQDTSR